MAQAGELGRVECHWHDRRLETMQGRPFNVQVQSLDCINSENGCAFRNNMEQKVRCASLERDFREEAATDWNGALRVIEKLHSRSGKK